MECPESDAAVLLKLSQGLLQTAVETDEEDAPVFARAPSPRLLERQHRLSRARAPGHPHPLGLTAPREQCRLLGGEPEELALFLPEPLRQWGTELHIAPEEVAEHRDPGFAGRLALFPRTDMKREYTVHSVGQRAHVARVDQDLARPVRCHRRLDGRIGERDGVNEQ